MLGYLKKFNSLSAELREKVSNPEAMATIENLERKYRLPLAALVMRVMVKEIALNDLVLFLRDNNLTETEAGGLAGELKDKIFFSVKNYLSPAESGRSIVLASPKPAAAAQTAAEKRLSPLKPPVKTAAAPVSRPSGKGAGFFFSPEDEKEIRELTKKIGLAEKTEISAEKIEAELEKIVNRAQINFGSANLADRFKEILRTYLRGIRNRLDTELTLTKSFTNGGLSFDKVSAQKVMALAGKVLNPEVDLADELAGLPAPRLRQASEAIKPVSKINIPELGKGSFKKLGASESGREKTAIGRDAPYDFSKLAKAVKTPAAVSSSPSAVVKPKPQFEELELELAPLTPALLPASPAYRTGRPDKQVVAPAKPKPFVPAPQENKPPVKKENKIIEPRPKADLPDHGAADEVADAGQMPLIRRRFEAENLSRSQKVKVEDVKYIPRVMSPLDEIKYLDLVNFRRLDKDPSAAAEKIKAKISLLEEESYGKKLEAIKLWRVSPVNRLYLEIGRSSIGGNKPVDVIIEERKIAGRDYLTAAEFKAIMDLNKSLRF